MSNMQTVDLTKLSMEELEKVKFLFPEAVDAELKSRASYNNEDELFLDTYSVKVVLEPLINGMKSCPTKKSLLDSGVLGLIEKILNTGDKKNKDYKAQWAALNPTPLEEAIAGASEEAPVEPQVEAPVEMPATMREEAPVEMPATMMETPAPVAAVEAPAPFVPVSAPAQALSMDAIMATAAMMKNK